MTLQNPINMGNINQLELQNLREIIGVHQNMVSKYDFYSNQCHDPQLKQLFKKSSQDAQTTVTNFINSLK
ncbi:hypothetical protein [Tepidimicrobium xylanilyticum]|uniref:Spore coat protein n=1 Tax=Tepidimicrobium xylanilyticum TaxID=1123352 RepID=A0A1H3B575_9FIRM|nr:hypothetical protein [Tepidimicrobium xylanilyticum]GMG97001.1 hypothetical protein EN5CB1_18270 [Tepidimicrobium xylanilyticum]SDX36781.1 hypothetical protein SAMN05660923_02171 [Tepidimicrobium xylanilyticum]